MHLVRGLEAAWRGAAWRGRDLQIIIADDPTNPKITITTFGMLDVYNELKNVWLQTKQSTAVDT